jgi:mono/diheme cytochrome c family protein
MTRVLVAKLAAGVCALAIAGCGQAAAPSASLLGARVDNFQLVDQEGIAQTLKYDRNAKAVVIAAHVVGDEASQSAAATLAELQKAHPDVPVMMINSSLSDDRDTIAAEAASKGLAIPVLDDPTQLIGDSLGFTYSGETVVVDPKTWTVVYHGPASAAGAAGKAKGYAAEAVAAVLAGQPVAVAEVKGRGASIDFPDRGKAAEFAKISYATDVAPILEKNCVACHSPGGIAPWAMTNYEMVKGFAPMIREAVRTDRMPPYNADAHVGEFQEYANLTEADTRTLIRWIEAGAPRGEGEDPLLADVKPRPDWPLGQPDLVVDIPKFDLPASGYVEYQMPAVASPLKEAKWLKATAFTTSWRAGSRSCRRAARATSTGTSTWAAMRSAGR